MGNENLSWKAKGILCYLLSLPEDWDVHWTEVAKHATDGKTSLRSGVDELKEAGYIKHEKKQDEKGKFRHNYYIYEYPDTDYPDPENPHLDNPHSGNQKLQRTNELRTNEQNTYIQKYADKIYRIHQHWLKECDHINDAKLTKKLKKKIAIKLKRWDEQNIKQAISNYAEIHSSGFYYSHNFTLFKFVKQSNGAPRFLEGLDQEYNGDIWKDYCQQHKLKSTTNRKEVEELYERLG